MAALGLTVANDIVNAALTYYVRGKTLPQTMEERPLVRVLREKQKTFPGGNIQVSSPVQGAYMSDTAGLFSGFQEDDALTFAGASNILRAQYPWKEMHAGLWISETELKKDDISVTDDMKTSEHSDSAATRLTGLLENRLDDFTESWARAFNLTCWKDGTQDAKVFPGIQSILTTGDPSVGTTGGLNRATYFWWRHRVSLNIAASGANQTLTRFLRTELRQLMRYQGKPNVALCGSDFIVALELEVGEKGYYTDSGWVNEGKTDFGMAKMRLKGLGTFDYDPTLDDLGLSKYCYVLDTRRIRLRPMEGEENKLRMPTRPYNYFVFLKSMTWTGTLEATQLNCNGVYSVA